MEIKKEILIDLLKSLIGYIENKEQKDINKMSKDDDYNDGKKMECGSEHININNIVTTIEVTAKVFKPDPPTIIRF